MSLTEVNPRAGRRGEKNSYADKATCQARGAKHTDRWSVKHVERRGHPILYPRLLAHN